MLLTRIWSTDVTDPYERRACDAMETVLKSLKAEEQHRVKGAMISNLEREWKFVSKVLDTSFFIAFSITALCLILYITFVSPHGQTFDFCPIHTGCEGMTDEQVLQIIEDQKKGRA